MAQKSIGFIAFSMALFVTTIAVAQTKPEPQPVAGTIDWVFDYEQGKLASDKSGKPIFLVIRCER